MKDTTDVVFEYMQKMYVLPVKAYRYKFALLPDGTLLRVLWEQSPQKGVVPQIKKVFANAEAFIPFEFSGKFYVMPIGTFGLVHAITPSKIVIELNWRKAKDEGGRSGRVTIISAKKCQDQLFLAQLKWSKKSIVLPKAIKIAKAREAG